MSVNVDSMLMSKCGQCVYFCLNCLPILVCFCLFTFCITGWRRILLPGMSRVVHAVVYTTRF